MVNTITILPAAIALLTATAAGSPLNQAPLKKQGETTPYPPLELSKEPICNTDGNKAPSSTDFSGASEALRTGGPYTADKADACTIVGTFNNARVANCAPKGVKPEELPNFTVTGEDVYISMNWLLKDHPYNCTPGISFGAFLSVQNDFKGDDRTRLYVDTLGL